MHLKQGNKICALANVVANNQGCGVRPLLGLAGSGAVLQYIGPPGINRRRENEAPASSCASRSTVSGDRE